MSERIHAKHAEKEPFSHFHFVLMTPSLDLDLYPESNRNAIENEKMGHGGRGESGKRKEQEEHPSASQDRNVGTTAPDKGTLT